VWVRRQHLGRRRAAEGRRARADWCQKDVRCVCVRARCVTYMLRARAGVVDTVAVAQSSDAQRARMRLTTARRRFVEPTMNTSFPIVCYFCYVGKDCG
jgi:hypothetical protein